MSITTKEKPFRFTGWHMAGCLIAFFSVIMVVNFSMAALASRTWTGLVVKNTYVASQKFNDHLTAAAEQARRGWYSRLAYRHGVLEISVFDATHAPRQLQNATLSYGRPAFEQSDRTLKLGTQSGGAVTTALHLDQGEWFLRLEGTLLGQPYRRDARLSINAKGEGQIE